MEQFVTVNVPAKSYGAFLTDLNNAHRNRSNAREKARRKREGDAPPRVTTSSRDYKIYDSSGVEISFSSSTLPTSDSPIKE